MSDAKQESSCNWRAYDDDLQGCLQWDGAFDDGARPVFADTWFVSEGRFHLCIQPRRLKLNTLFLHSADYFERQCRELWRDRDDGSVVRFQVIDNGPMRLPSTKFHIVLIQGNLLEQQWTMLHSIISPPLYRHRVVIFPRGLSVSDFFRTAQVEGACSNLARSCFVKFHDGRQVRTYVNDDRMEVPQHRYVEGGIRLFENEPDDGEVSRDRDSETSTNVPDPENEDGVEDFSLIDLELAVSSENRSSGSVHCTGNTSVARPHRVGDEDNSDITWSWVSSHQQHQADENAQAEEDEILSLMATDPLANHVHNPWQQPWNDVDDGVNEMELAEEEGISISFAHNQMETTQQHIEHILADVLEEQQDDIWTVVTFGLGLVDLGRRDTTAHPRDMDGLMRNVLELWEDHAQYGDLSLYCVSPQPMDIAGEKSIVLIVKVEMQEQLEPGARCVLVLERAVPDVRVRPQHYAAFLLTHSIMHDLFRQLNLQEHCPPYTTRDCGMRLGMTTLNEENVYDFEHGTFCLTWIGPRPEEVVQAMQRVGNAEEFFVQFFRLMAFQPERDHVTFAVHGISPANRPLGRRDGIFSVNEVQSLSWIDVVTQLWPFSSTECTISFVPDLTADMQELGFECFNFIVSYGGHDEAVIMVHQQLGAVEEMSHHSSTVDEFWALRVPRNCIAHNVPGTALGSPFWFRYARSQNVYPYLFVGGQRAREVHRNWQDGDVLTARFHVWQRHHILIMLLREGDIDEGDRSLEETSFLQKKSIVRLGYTNEDDEIDDCTTDVFTEICHSLRQQVVTAQNDLDGSAPVSVQEVHPLSSAEKDGGNPLLWHMETIDKPSFGTVQVLQGNEGDPPESRNCSDSRLHLSDSETIACLDELNRHLNTLMMSGWQGLNTDFAFLPTLHPFAEIACQWTGGCREASGTFHVFTDGSCRSGKAAWAFVVLCEQKGHDGARFVRVGYAAGRVQEDIGPCEQTAQDAEATAIIAAVEFLLSRQNTQIVEVHLHFDATAVGYGIMGKTNLIQQDHKVSARQWSARVLMSILQRKHRQWFGYHVHAHQGHPWNEFVDSLAGMVTNGWLPHVHAVLRSGPLLRHCLADWAWMQVCPNIEIPSLEEVLVNSTPQPGQFWFDETLKSAQEVKDDSTWVGQITFASANVCTLEQDQVLPGTSVTYKAAELMKQFQDAEATIVGVQESRARSNGQHNHGPFTCLVAAGDKGQAGVELWINGPVLSRDLRIDFNPREDVGVIHATARIMVAQCHFGRTMLAVIVAYAPQRGRGEHEIGAWWSELRSIIRDINKSVPCVVLGDLNCRIGSVETDMIGGVGADFEDFAGEKLRELCQEYRLLIPSTMPDFHEGRSWTHVSTHGFEHRLDYILVSETCRDSIISSWVDQDIDLLNGEKDHRVVMLKMEVTVANAARGTVRNTRLYDRDAARACKSQGDYSLLEDFDFCDWNRDTNDHWAEMRSHIQDRCVKWFPTQKRVKRQIYFSEQTWHMLCQRKELRQEHRRLQRECSLRWLKLFFGSWRDKNMAKETLDEWHLANHAGWMQEAVILEARRGVDRQFRKTKRQDWKHWVQEKLHDTVSKLHHAKASDIYKIIQPKQMIDKKKGKRNKHLPGLQDSEGKWNTSKIDVAVAWQKQFAAIENAEQVDFQHLLERSVPTCEAIAIDQLLKIPTIYDLERAVRAMSDRKATGVDNIGAEVWQMQVVQTVTRVFPLFLKSALRKQAVVEHTGGWILPLYEGKGNPCKMAGYRAILLEPTLGRIFSKTWRPAIVKSLENVAHAM